MDAKISNFGLQLLDGSGDGTVGAVDGAEDSPVGGTVNSARGAVAGLSVEAASVVSVLLCVFFFFVDAKNSNFEWQLLDGSGDGTVGVVDGAEDNPVGGTVDSARSAVADSLVTAALVVGVLL